MRQVSVRAERVGVHYKSVHGNLRAPISGSNLPHQSRDDVLEKVPEAYQRHISSLTRSLQVQKSLRV